MNEKTITALQAIERLTELRARSADWRDVEKLAFDLRPAASRDLVQREPFNNLLQVHASMLVAAIADAEKRGEVANWQAGLDALYEWQIVGG